MEVGELQPIKVFADLGSVNNIEEETRHAHKRRDGGKVAAMLHTLVRGLHRLIFAEREALATG